MRLAALSYRGLRYHWRAYVAVALGVVVGTAALTGALLAGDAMRGSLRDAAVGGLGRIDYALVAPRFFREALADDLARAQATQPTDAARQSERAHGSGFEQERETICPAILTRGSVIQADSHATANGVNVIGADQRFWELGTRPNAYSGVSEAGRTVLLNQSLADDLHAVVGSDVLLHLSRPSAVPLETLLGRRDEAAASIRLTVVAIIPNEDLGAFNLAGQAARPRNAYVPLSTLQRALHQEKRINAVLVAAQQDPPRAAAGAAGLNDLLPQEVTLTDLGLRLRTSEEYGYVALESDAFVLDFGMELASQRAARDIACEMSAVSVYLANTIALADHPEAVIPYSMIAGVQLPTELPVTPALRYGGEGPESALGPDGVLLNEWAADELHAKLRDRVRLSFYVIGPDGQLRTVESGTFTVYGIVRMEGIALDRGWVPEFPGVTDAKTISDWHPPFPIDLTKIRKQDEAYWEKYGATPKAFLSVWEVAGLWMNFGRLTGRFTSLRIQPRSGQTLAETREAFEAALRKQIGPADFGLRFDDVRERALAASSGANDFSSLFVSFSFFLILSAAMLVALLFRLGVERRVSEIGTLLSLGFTPRRVLWVLLAEGGLVAVCGGAVGLAVARGYARLVLMALQSWWPSASDVPTLRPHDTPESYVIGYGVSVFIAVASIAWSLRGLTRLPARALLSGAIESASQTATARRQRCAAVIALGALALAASLSVWSLLEQRAASGGGAATQSAMFFGAGSALLAAAIAGLAWWLGRGSHVPVRKGGLSAMLRLGIRNARRHRGRSLLTAGLIASATFLIAALQSMRLEAPADPSQRDSGTGGFTLMAEATVPLPYDLGTPEGRAALNISGPAEATLARATFMPFRLHAGDETSCLNLYQPAQPRLLGAPRALVERGGFTFSRTLADATAEQRNPWLLLSHKFPDNAIPVIGDEASVLWQLHRNLGEDVVVTSESGASVRLRVAGMLSGSVLQGELILAEDALAALFPSSSGHAFWLIDATPSQADAIRQTLERELTDSGVSARSTRGRLAELFAVQNAYLSAFQALGALGLLLGAVGLVAVLLRNVWERRSELALLQAIGFSRRSIGWLVLSENAVLVGAGLLSGWLAAGLAILPQALARASLAPWWTVLPALVAIFAVAILSAVTALVLTLRERLIPALRAE